MGTVFREPDVDCRRLAINAAILFYEPAFTIYDNLEVVIFGTLVSHRIRVESGTHVKDVVYKDQCLSNMYNFNKATCAS